MSAWRATAKFSLSVCGGNNYMVSFVGYEAIDPNPFSLLAKIKLATSSIRDSSSYGDYEREKAIELFTSLMKSGQFYRDYVSFALEGCEKSTEINNYLPSQISWQVRADLEAVDIAAKSLRREVCGINWLKFIKGDSAKVIEYWEHSDGSVSEGVQRVITKDRLNQAARFDLAALDGSFGVAYGGRSADEGASRPYHALNLGLMLDKNPTVFLSACERECVTLLTYTGLLIERLLALDANLAKYGYRIFEDMNYVESVESAESGEGNSSAIIETAEAKFIIGLFG